jgi:glycosyltransferase involved in cell wall biosynthesis
MDKNSPLVSIALCTYNGQDFLEEQLSSILSQSYRHLEVIVCDDGSTDRTLQIVGDFAAKDSRIKVYQNPKNLGFNKNFEQAISLTSGEYIAISDQDDIWEKDKIRLLYEYIQDNLLIFSNSLLMDRSGKLLGGQLLSNFSIQDKSFKAYLLHNYTTGHTCLFRREFLEYILPLPEVGYYDWWMGFVALYHQKITFLDKPLTRHRVHSGSVIQTVFSHEKAKSQADLFNTDLNIRQLKVFRSYHNLLEEDRNTIDELVDDLETKKRKFSIRLFRKLLFFFDDYIVSKKKRSFFSKINFARKYARSVG